MPLPNNTRNILVLFPHPDDEVFSVGGLMRRAARANIATTLAVFTKGECGTPDGHSHAQLKKIRSQELKKSAYILNIRRLFHYDMGDGKLDGQKKDLRQRVKKLLDSVKPQLVITYDQSGLYGHPDHIALSTITTRLIKAHYPHIQLWYTTWPSLLMRIMPLPVHMARDESFRTARTTPNHSVWIGSDAFHKLRAARSHASQRLPLPLSLLPWEFFHVVK